MSLRDGRPAVRSGLRHIRGRDNGKITGRGRRENCLGKTGDRLRLREALSVSTCDAGCRTQSFGSASAGNFAIDGYQRIIQLIANHLADQTRRGALIIASGIVSTPVGAVTLAEIAPDSTMAGAILRKARFLSKNPSFGEVPSRERGDVTEFRSERRASAVIPRGPPHGHRH